VQFAARRTDRRDHRNDDYQQPQYSGGRPVNQVSIEAYDSQPSPLTMYLVAALDHVTHAVRSVITDSTFNTAAAAIGFAAAKISFFGVAGPQAAALVLTASIVHSVVRPTIERTLELRPNGYYYHATIALNTAVITIAVATYLGLAIPAAKGLVLAAGVTALVKYAQLVMSQYKPSLIYPHRRHFSGYDQ
jgi:hypothetical protein